MYGNRPVPQPFGTLDAYRQAAQQRAAGFMPGEMNAPNIGPNPSNYGAAAQNRSRFGFKGQSSNPPGLDPRAIAANPQGFEDWNRRRLQQQVPPTAGAYGGQVAKPVGYAPRNITMANALRNYR
jgi:hypothetical protein